MPTPEPWSLHPQLARDTVAIGDLALSRVLVAKDANRQFIAGDELFDKYRLSMVVP